MKIKTILLIMILLAMPIAIAQEEELLARQAGMTPDNLFYGISVALERLSLVFKAGKNKALARVELVNERLAEAKLMADKGKDIETQKALIEHQKDLESLEEDTKELRDEEKSGIEEKTRESKIVLEGIIDRIKKDQNPNNDNALQGLQRALDNQDKKLSSIRESISADKRIEIANQKNKIVEKNKNIKSLYSIYGGE